VNYTNSSPFIHGISKYCNSQNFKLSLDTPAECYLKFENREADIGLVPTIAMKKFMDAHIVSPYCIGAMGEVKSVILASSCKIEELQKVYLDYQSRTSVELVKILSRHYWKISPEFVNAKKGIEDSIPRDKTGFVIIGDRSFRFYNQGLHITDLAKSWYDYTGKPMVFACWMGRREIETLALREFNECLSKGLDARPYVIEESRNVFEGSGILAEDYFYKNIRYNFDDSAREGMELFLNLLQ
jgi:chorismate dehydratase